ncbi:MAG: LuxR C-terminal-related transcriptional regulator [Phycisphaerae bacterium]|jgi:DNA-binding NarL/FixJ family response regulator
MNDWKSETRMPQISPDMLSAEELRVAKLLAAGCSPDSIAAALAVQREAIEAHCESIYSMLGTADRATLIRWARHYDIGRW